MMFLYTFQLEVMYNLNTNCIYPVMLRPYIFGHVIRNDWARVRLVEELDMGLHDVRDIHLHSLVLLLVLWRHESHVRQNMATQRMSDRV